MTARKRSARTKQPPARPQPVEPPEAMELEEDLPADLPAERTAGAGRATMAEAMERRGRDEQGRLACPTCGCHHLPVYYNKHRGGVHIRVRICRHCGRRVTTWERAI
jgi:hypothetical protein